ncbi:tRNA guanosine-2 -O-methyltransferase TRM11 [Olea europaea subsp. europaea]|uniref:tRNA guanosine-2 -O-methyltransferase TRM11, partial n=1 Tax=Olea europaea subsp. europaea TaxID=158383 RepID=A0A8S0USF3_OLEEU|nr:tRNA guanosine-2 -O-methyltransferase TRM11 [Olea europaea subsp. europaea]
MRCGQTPASITASILSFFPSERYERAQHASVNLKRPDHKFFLADNDDYGSENGLPFIVHRRIFFSQEIRTADSKIWQTYQLKSCKYLGPKAMDAEMAVLISNEA